MSFVSARSIAQARAPERVMRYLARTTHRVAIRDRQCDAWMAAKSRSPIANKAPRSIADDAPRCGRVPAALPAPRAAKRIPESAPLRLAHASIQGPRSLSQVALGPEPQRPARSRPVDSIVREGLRRTTDPLQGLRKSYARPSRKRASAWVRRPRASDDRLVSIAIIHRPERSPKEHGNSSCR